MISGRDWFLIAMGLYACLFLGVLAAWDVLLWLVFNTTIPS